MKKSRYAALFLVLALLFAALSGCGGSPETTEAPAATPTAIAEPTQQATEAPAAEATDAPEDAGSISLPLTEEEVIFTYWYAMPGPWSGVIDDITQTSVYQELQRRTGVTLELVAASGTNAVDTFNVMIASEEYTDMINGMGMYYTGGLDKAYEDGVGVDLMEYIDLMPNMSAVLDQYDVWSSVLTDSGLLLRAPELNINSGANQGALIRADWLEDLGLEVPETYDQLHDVLVAFQTEKGADAALWLSFAGAWANNGLGNGYGTFTFTHTQRGEAPWYQVDGQVQFGPITEGFRAYTQMLADWYAEGLIYRDFFTDEYSIKEPDPGLISGNRVGVFTSQRTTVNEYQRYAEEAGGSLLAISDFVQNEGDARHGYVYQSIVDGFRGDYITTACKDIELLVRWLDYRYSDEGIFLMNYGLEGEGHEMVNGEPVLTDLVLNNPDGISVMTTQNLYTAGSGGSVFDASRINVNMSELESSALEVWDDGTIDNLYAYPTVCTMTSEESETYSTTYSDIQTYWTETFLRFITGEISIDAGWDTYIATMESMGIQDCIDVKQAALDRYYAR